MLGVTGAIVAVVSKNRFVFFLLLAMIWMGKMDLKALKTLLKFTDHTPSHWSSLPDSFCGGDRQSPINIVTRNVWTGSDLHNFTFTNFSSPYIISTIENTGHTGTETVAYLPRTSWVEYVPVFKTISTCAYFSVFPTVKCNLEKKVEVSGGGLKGIYSAVQFHFHWGDTEHHPGSEHMIDGHRYPMEVL